MSQKRNNRCIRRIALLCGLMTMVLLLALLPGLSPDIQVQAAEAGIPVEENPEPFVTRSMPTHGEGKIAIFLIDFPDYPNENPNATVSYYEGLYFNGGVEPKWGTFDSVSDFYYKHSYGKLSLSGKVFDWYTAKHERAYYENDKAALVQEAAEYYLAQGVDFSQFDGDNDGVIDGIIYHFAGPADPGDSDPWYDGRYTATSRESGFGNIGSMKFISMIQINEEAGTTDRGYVSTICHELLHSLGMGDLYGMAYDDDPVTDLMAAEATCINPYYKLLLGWIPMEDVQIITKDTKNIRLDIYGKEVVTGTWDAGIAIVTDSYQGLFDEFYLVVYRSYGQYLYPVIYHIDARLNEDGTAFLCDNNVYDPRPDIENKHGTQITNPSPYLFMEELSGNPDYYLAWKSPSASDDAAFGADSVFGPNSYPSSDTHDGGYTGIKIYNFNEHDKAYLTFDVSFVTDNAAPLVTTQQSDLAFKETVTLQFNEYIYEGPAWKDIRVTDLAGNTLQANILLPYYPNHIMEIQFLTSDYEDGYQIHFPEGAVKDSSGNLLAATTLTASADGRLFPISSVQLPGTGTYDRTNEWPRIFLHENDMVVFSHLMYTGASQLELLRLDLQGNVLQQTFVDNPFGKTYISSFLETEDGSYICICESDALNYCDKMFCIGSDGTIKWVNTDHCGTGIDLVGWAGYQNYTQGELLIIYDYRSNALYSINANTGELRPASVNFLADVAAAETAIFDISSDTVLMSEGTHLKLIDKASGQIKLEGQISGVEKVSRATANDDGTLLLLCSGNGQTYAYLLDARLQTVKSITLQSSYIDKFAWFDNDGFWEAIPLDWGGHVENTKYHVRRHDRYLNLVWKADVSADCIHYYKAANGELMAFKSVSHPQKLCSIERYGSDEGMKTAHVHTLEHIKAVSATCSAAGSKEYWRCSSCGCIYSDAGQTLVTDAQDLVIPATGAHKEERIPGTSPSCTASGLTDGYRCSVCKKTLQAQESIPALGHDPGKDATCTTAQVCTRCEKTLKNALGHSFGEWSVTQMPTTEAEGLMVRSCGRCGTEESLPVDKLPAPTVPPTVPTEPPTVPTAPTTTPALPTTVPTQPTTIPAQSTTSPDQPTVAPTQSTVTPTIPAATASVPSPTAAPTTGADSAPQSSPSGILVIGVVAVLVCMGTATGIVLRRKRK